MRCDALCDTLRSHVVLESSRITCDHRVSQSASYLTDHTPIACITYHNTTSLLSHITHHASHHTSCMGATGCLSSATQCHPLYNFIRKISIEIPYRAPLRAVERTELSGSMEFFCALVNLSVHVLLSVQSSS